MKKTALATAVLILLGGCGGTAPEPEEKVNREVKPVYFETRTARQGEIQSRYPMQQGLPVWFYNPDYAGKFGAVGIAKPPKKGGIPAQKRVAEGLAKAELAKKVSVAVTTETTLEKEGSASEYRRKLTSLSKQQAEALLKNAVVEDSWMDSSSGELYLWVVLPEGN